MSRDDSQIDIAITAWLQRLIQDRLSPELQLARQCDGWLLRVGGQPGQVKVDSRKTDLSAPPLQIACSRWKPEEEGFDSPVAALPVVGMSVLPSPLVIAVEDGHTIGYDILSFAYWMLARVEEIGRTDLDNHGRFPATSSHAYLYGYLDKPVVDHWLDVLGQVLCRQWPQLPLKQHRFAIRLSHDVDRPSRYGFASGKDLVRLVGGDVIKRKDLAAVVRAPWIRLNSTRVLNSYDPYNTFDWLMDVSERHGLVSAFYFICGRTDPDRDADYEPEHPAIRDLIRKIHRRGHEIGLHPSYGTYLSPEAIAKEAARLKQICAEEGVSQVAWGGRMHYLRWHTPTTLHGWEQAGMDYDSSMGYADMPGFRSGTCFEYDAFDPVAKRRLGLRIRPLVVMECAVIAPGYMGLGTGEAASDKFAALKSACEAVGGTFTLLWHNSELSKPSHRALYEQIVRGAMRPSLPSSSRW